MKTARKYAWKPDVADHRDKIYKPRVTAAQLPPKVDIIGKGSPIDDQGDLGSCTGNSSTAMLELILKTTNLSRLMAYYNGRAIEGTTTEDAGCEIRNVIKAISKLGVGDEKLWPYVISRFAKKPPQAAYDDGLKRVVPLVASYQRILTLNALKGALAVGHPVTFGFAVPDYFESATVERTGWVKFPGTKDRIIGGHAVVAVGYDDTVTKPFVWVRNSYGAGWGLKGYFKMDQRWFTDPSRLADDMWTVIPKK